MLAAIQRALDQLHTVSDYRVAQKTTTVDSNLVTAATSEVRDDEKALDAAQRGKGGALAALAGKDVALRNVAIAAYVGVGYAPPQVTDDIPDPPGAEASQNNSTLGALSGNEALYAAEMITLVGQQALRSVAGAKHQVSLAAASVEQAERQVDRAKTALVDAEKTFASQQHDELVAAQAAASAAKTQAAARAAAATSSSALYSPTILGPAVLDRRGARRMVRQYRRDGPHHGSHDPAGRRLRRPGEGNRCA